MTKGKKHRIDPGRLLAIFVILLGVVYFNFNVFSPAALPRCLRIGMIRRPMTLLLLGTDITFDAKTKKPMPEKNGRADTILLTRIDPLKDKVSILAIPRDTLINIPGIGKTKINSANAYGGVDLMKEMVVQVTGQQVDYYIEVKPTAVPHMVDMVGGVTIDIEQDMRYRDRAQGLDIDLKKGRQTLSGKQAHDYIRWRNNFSGDIGRIGRQQKFLKALTRSLISPANVLQAPFAIHTALQEIKTDLPMATTIRLLNWSRTLSTEAVSSVMLPGDVGFTQEAGSVWLPNEAAVQSAINDLF
ncbi:MAG: LCP family protein [Candidatus Saganbacteria bacterium]|nr:LCP family protein [Candidatus Saganbacteria bacterium]